MIYYQRRTGLAGAGRAARAAPPRGLGLGLVRFGSARRPRETGDGGGEGRGGVRRAGPAHAGAAPGAGTSPALASGPTGGVGAVRAVQSAAAARRGRWGGHSWTQGAQPRGAWGPRRDERDALAPRTPRAPGSAGGGRPCALTDAASFPPAPGGRPGPNTPRPCPPAPGPVPRRRVSRTRPRGPGGQRDRGPRWPRGQQPHVTPHPGVPGGATRRAEGRPRHRG